MSVVLVSSLLRKREAPCLSALALAREAIRKAHWVAVSSSGGKDSVVSLDVVAELLREMGMLDKLVVIHADLGEMEWPGTKVLAKRQADRYGARFEVVSRIGGVAAKTGKTYEKGEVFGDILDYTRHRGMWPDAGARFCTSEFKRGPIGRVFTKLVGEWRSSRGLNPRGRKGGVCRIVDVMGLRGEESPKRKKRPVFEVRKDNGRVHIDTWLPIKDWLTTHVWAHIERRELESHPAYVLGMPRLSCVFCVFAPKAALVLAGKANPELLRKYVEVEKEIDHRFRNDMAIAEVLTAVELDEEVDTSGLAGEWETGM